ncbi:uncharacterized protein FFNC_15684 [Fusarium fujikuroi]|nr:uncharacterized protein FFNC_15684 [Fusarium fujikuroi]
MSGYFHCPFPFGALLHVPDRHWPCLLLRQESLQVQAAHLMLLLWGMLLAYYLARMEDPLFSLPTRTWTILVDLLDDKDISDGSPGICLVLELSIGNSGHAKRTYLLVLDAHIPHFYLGHEGDSATKAGSDETDTEFAGDSEGDAEGVAEDN